MPTAAFVTAAFTATALLAACATSAIAATSVMATTIATLAPSPLPLCLANIATRVVPTGRVRPAQSCVDRRLRQRKRRHAVADRPFCGERERPRHSGGRACAPRDYKRHDPLWQQR
eukprot:3996676-Prymnesium_polylepis.1